MTQNGIFASSCLVKIDEVSAEVHRSESLAIDNFLNCHDSIASPVFDQGLVMNLGVFDCYGAEMISFESFRRLWSLVPSR